MLRYLNNDHYLNSFHKLLFPASLAEPRRACPLDSSSSSHPPNNDLFSNYFAFR